MKPLALLPVSLMIGCAGTKQKPPEVYAYNPGPLRPQFEKINLADGVDAAEADVLATIYFLRYDGYCGFNEPVIRKGDQWRAGTMVGYGGARQPDIIIDARTGAVQQRGHPVSKTPWRDLEESLRNEIDSVQRR